MVPNTRSSKLSGSKHSFDTKDLVLKIRAPPCHIHDRQVFVQVLMTDM